MHLLQVCNVGDICGGTAACAWSVTRALPMFQHTVVFLSAIAPETRAAFRACRLLSVSHLDAAFVGRLNPDLCLLHNTGAGRVDPVPNIPTVLYRHSAGLRAAADLEVCCSNWLARQLSPPAPVLHQGVPVPIQPQLRRERSLAERIVVGRLCTPSKRKWPASLVDFYSVLASDHPQIDWEFVGCPLDLHPELKRACRGNAVFHSPGWQARSRFWRWDALLYHHPTLTESFGRIVAESMRAGCVPIVDGRGGFLEQVTPQAGYLCRSPSDFSSALKALADWTTRRKMSRAAKARADEHFSLAAFSRRLLQLFRSAADFSITDGPQRRCAL